MDKKEKIKDLANKLKQGCELIEISNKSVRSAAKMVKVNNVTLWRYMENKKKGVTKSGYNPSNKIFSEEQEKALSEYLIIASFCNYGFSTRNARKLAYECAVKYKLKCPPEWVDNQMAGKMWLQRFMKRNPELSHRILVPTSLARLKNFNKENLAAFYEKLASLYEKYKFSPESIYNIDETGLNTVQTPKKVITQKGAKRIGSATSGERGTTVTMMLGISASGNMIPPHFIFPRKIFKDFFLINAPINSIGTANGSGWMQEDDFNIYIRHFAKYSRANLENPLLLTMDNHSSHLSLDAIDFCKSNGIICLTFPPHCTHKLQPLDKTIFGPFGNYFETAQDDWTKNNLGKAMTIYDLPGLTKDSLLKAVTFKNISSGFACTGIFPFNKNLFEKEINFQEKVVQNINPLKTSNTPLAESAKSGKINFSPFKDFPIPKIFKKNEGGVKRGRKPLKCQILTDTPVRNRIASNKENREIKLRSKTEIAKKRVKKVKKKLF